ncbi:hypothetical protein QBC34DRAFT_56761 [Podospora aff. communis PSN243]|uniref:Uncharacterized protein n=1 Tax=Podospora aff. communis PSN243 TaxID=3040156 RepID=A0AAV9GRN9_9PEZI|nr:hypothetical protein QBC34DRAFT_56761 [Podospora aff. communis PSN243]
MGLLPRPIASTRQVKAKQHHGQSVGEAVVGSQRYWAPWNCSATPPPPQSQLPLENHNLPPRLSIVPNCNRQFFVSYPDWHSSLASSPTLCARLWSWELRTFTQSFTLRFSCLGEPWSTSRLNRPVRYLLQIIRAQYVAESDLFGCRIDLAGCCDTKPGVIFSAQRSWSSNTRPCWRWFSSPTCSLHICNATWLSVQTLLHSSPDFEAVDPRNSGSKAPRPTMESLWNV